MVNGHAHPHQEDIFLRALRGTLPGPASIELYYREQFMRTLNNVGIYVFQRLFRDPPKVTVCFETTLEESCMYNKAVIKSGNLRFVVERAKPVKKQAGEFVTAAKEYRQK